MAKQKTRKNVAIVTIEAEVVLPDDPILSAEALLEVNAQAKNAADFFPDAVSAIKIVSRKALPPSEPVVEAPAKAA